MAMAWWGLFAKRRRPAGRVALSLSNERIGLVVQAGAGRAARAFERVPSADTAASLAELVREAGAEGLACDWVLDPGSYSLLQVEKPQVPQGEWIAALKWKVRDLIGFPVEDAVMDAFEVPGLESRGRPSTLYLAVARKDELRPRIAQIQAAGLVVAGIGIADLAWAGAARRLDSAADSLAVLVLDARGGTMLALREDTLFVSRRFEYDAEDQRALREPGGERGGRLFERIALELQRTLDYFDRTHQRPPPRRLLLLGADDAVAGIDEALRGMLGLEVRRADPAGTWPELAGQAPASRARLATLAAWLGETA